MKDMLSRIQQSSNVPMKNQREWKQLTNQMIAMGEAPRLSEAGLLQVVDLCAWHLATDTHLYLHDQIPEEEWATYFDKKGPALDLIQETAAVSSGIHPNVITEMVMLRADYYTELYLRLGDSHAKR